MGVLVSKQYANGVFQSGKFVETGVIPAMKVCSNNEIHIKNMLEIAGSMGKLYANGTYACPQFIEGSFGGSLPSQGSVQVTNTGDLIERTTDLPNFYNFSMGGWFKMVTPPEASSGEYATILGMAGTDAYSHIYFDDTMTLILSTFATDTAFSSSPAANTWFYVGLTCSGTGAGEVVARWWDSTFTLQDTVTGIQKSLDASDVMSLCSYWGAFLGRASCVRVWDDVLTQGEFETEMATATIQNTTNIYSAFEDDPEVDVSGSSHPWSIVSGAGVSITAADYPPITWT